MPSNELEVTDTTGSVEEPSRGGGDAPERAERHNADAPTTDNGHHAAAETRTRQEYAGDLRGQGDPIPAAERPDRGAAPVDQPATPPRDSPAPDRAGTPDLAEPRDRETYARDIRAESASPIPDTPPANDRTPVTDDAARSEDSTDAGRPSQADQDRWHAMYQEFLDDARLDRDPRAGAVSEKPEPLPADAGDRPPTGEELLEMEPEESRAAAFRREFYKPETIEGIHDTIEQNADDAPLLFERPPTGSQVDVPSSIPQIAQQIPEGISASHLAMAGLVTGILAFEFGRWIHRKIDK
jgi:hypothetical protein